MSFLDTFFNTSAARIQADIGNSQAVVDAIGGETPPPLNDVEKIEGTKNYVEDSYTLPDSDILYNGPETFKYPLNLNYDEQPHSILFEIFTRVNTNLGNFQYATDSLEGNTANIEAASEAYKTRDAGKPENISGIIGAGLGIVGTWYTTAGALQVAKGNTDGVTKALGGAMTAAAGGWILANQNAFKREAHIRLEDFIELYVPGPPESSYSAEWEGTSFGPVLGGLAGQINSVGALESVFSGDKGSLAEAATRAIISGLGSLPKQIGGGDLEGYVSSTTGKVINPYREQIFRSMGYRKFGFTYKFAPRNINEYRQVEKIIKTFKYHMHPEKYGLFLKYPAEFVMTYRYKGEENPNLFKTKPSALTDMKVVYGSADGYNTIMGTGIPSEINLQLSFTEIEILANDSMNTNTGESTY